MASRGHFARGASEVGAPFALCRALPTAPLARPKVSVDARPTGEVAASPPARDGLEADFRARLNPPGTWIDFGKLATEGSVMIRREPDRLVLYPYPRERRFRVSLDVKTLTPAADLAHLQVRALAAGGGRDLGLVAAVQENGRLVLTAGTPGAGRYVIGWKSR